MLMINLQEKFKGIYPTDFLLYLSIILNFEGHLSDDPRDTGGKTNRGISQANNADLDVMSLTLAEIVDIYYHRYYLKVYDATFSPALMLLVADSAVHEGIHRPKQYLKSADGHYALFWLAKYRNFETYRQWINGEFRNGWRNRLDLLLKEASKLDAQEQPRKPLGVLAGLRIAESAIQNEISRISGDTEYPFT